MLRICELVGWWLFVERRGGRWIDAGVMKLGASKREGDHRSNAVVATEQRAQVSDFLCVFPSEHWLISCWVSRDFVVERFSSYPIPGRARLSLVSTCLENEAGQQPENELSGSANAPRGGNDWIVRTREYRQIQMDLPICR